ncbi:iron ABC transporter permease [Hydrogenophaga sp.]|uniref:FecCD family ABC transporter permease n=1 Tax=Hydrogenophaga sp. TaxID=1904254 RepID=UPI0025BF2C9D|nr:iron ABC transporter permease [Hydrogenophaga sp.]MBT9465357.1 iron ABC transporter permease [Hydrogenophaga sp.]
MRSGAFWAVGVLLAGVLVAFSQGRTPLALFDLWQLAWAVLQGAPPPNEQTQTIVLQIRGPRVLAAIAVGSALAVAGAAFQGLFRNPLVSPDILGASAGAALGAVLGIYFSMGVFGIQMAAFAGGLLAVALVYGVGSTVRNSDPVLVLLLAGIVIGSLLGAGIGMVKVLADPYNQLPAMTFWLLGSLSAAHADDLPALIVPVALGTVVLLLLRWRMDVMSLPEEEARSLGARTTALRLLIVAAATLVTAASVAAAGIVGWVGLVVPHLARFLVGPSFVRLLPTSAVLGGGLLLFIDTLARTVAPVEIPLGILTALIGSPFFIFLLRRASRGWT